MAAIQPTFSFCLNTNCSKLTITDTTGLWDSGTGIKKWSNPQVVGGVVLGDINTSYLTFTNIDTEEEFVFTLKDTTGVNLYPTDASNSFAFTDFNWTAGDGLYSIALTMTVDAPHTVVAYTDKVLFTCEAEACITEQWKSYFTDCNCNGNKDVYMKALEMEALLKGVTAEFVCNQDQKSIKILNTLSKICDMTDGDCGCS